LVERAFDMDWANSSKDNARLRPTEFGYRSIHYVLTVNPGKLSDQHIATPVPQALLASPPLKAELQVRTLLEHAWANIGHDLLYKTEVRIPDHIHRQFAIIAAMLENADH